MTDPDSVRSWAARMARRWSLLLAGAFVPRERLWRGLFVGEDGELSRAGEIVLADLRRFCFRTPDPDGAQFRSDPLELARRQGRREVFERIAYFLNLDEAMVQQILETDDGRDADWYE